MGKAPAFQFYPKDWRGDSQLQMASLATRGAWHEMICCMWDAPERGKLTGTKDGLARLLGCSLSDFEFAINEITSLNIGTVTESHGNITVICRRMVRDESERTGSRKRSYKYRERHESRPNHANITVPSSSSSSSSTSSNIKEGENAPFKLPEKEQIQEAAEPLILQQISQVCKQLYDEKIFPEVNAFKNKMLKSHKNHRAILHTLSRAYLKKEFEEGPWAYCMKVIEIESGKYNARDYRKTTPENTR